MGVALLVMFPVLYTDTTDAWRLTNKKDRLSIVLAGVKTELYIAMIATFLYSLTPSGIFQQMLFIIATTSWVSSIIMNISPFLRFDGYYALSDISDTKNLQPRSFAMAKWFIRREIIGIIEPRPEMVSRARESFFIIYAMATWVYRFFLFLGIAVMVYYFAFKLLGIVLFAVEIVWFILLPISKEIKVWYRYKKEININKYTVRTLSILVLLVVLFVWPWQKSITLDAIVESKEYTQLYAPKSAKIDKIYIKDKDIVKKGDTLIALSSKKLDSQIESLTLQTKLIKAQLKKIATEKELLNMKIVLQERLNKKYVALFSLQEAKENMIIKAPFDGVVSLKNIKNSMYISSDDVLVSIYNPNRLSVTAFCNSNQKDKIAIGDEAKVFFVNTILEPLEIRVDSISDISIATLEYLELSSQLGGDIETKIVDKNHITKEAYFKISSSITTAYYPMHYRTKAKMAIVVEDDSLASKFFTKAISVVIRESGF
jgi:putative peptide zinc metalloprotease protein